MANDTPFDCSYLDAIDVSFEDLSTAITFIDGLIEYAEHINDVQMAKNIVGTMPKDTADGTPFGGFWEARTQWARVQNTTDSMVRHLSELREKLGYLKSGTQRVMANYRTVEERNAMGANRIAALLAPGAGADAPSAAEERGADGSGDGRQSATNGVTTVDAADAAGGRAT